MLLLAFDTATPAVTVALHDGASVIAQYTEVDARRHGELLAPGIVRVLAEAGRSRTELTDVAVGVGPGPFTGLRVGLVTAVALGDALELPVHGICTLDVLAAQASAEGFAGGSGVGESDNLIAGASGPDGRFAVAIDARRKEVYWAVYQDRPAASGGPVRVSGPDVDWPHVVAGQVAGLPVAGEGPVKYPQDLPRAVGPLLPGAGELAGLAVARLRDGGEILPPHPLYLRRPDAVEPAASKPVSSPALR
ncbi:MAG TPA: tRNA (adenosine(37)-N6)-threonylcarbamoyltransferase complex dimerization subunit type 1 TsaB [Actinocrinis sp.]|nr:tRNA (adenosine(37)-N6)-threonylcarbamoyltransferase complex dimerization subunit type 1 TsaB [Actinocrinis sp.]